MPRDTDRIAGLQQVLVQQFMLHEVEHHALQAGPDRAATALVPVAHGLIDIYKCLHQAEFGVGHTIDHPDGFRQRLYQEMMRGAASGQAREPAVESLSADGGMLRVNLRALRSVFIEDAAMASAELARVCVESARRTRGDNARFFAALDQFKMLNRAGGISLAGHVFAFPVDWVDTFLLEVHELMRRIRQVPVFSHSDNYKRLNRPSYRVVERSVLEASPLDCILEKKIATGKNL